MAQTFPLVSIDPSTKTGTQLATDLENFSETMRSMMSGPARAAEFIEGLWLRTHPDGTAELVYSNAAQNVDLPIFTVAQNGTGIELTTSVGLASAPAATTDESGVVRLATEAEALAGTSATRVPLVRETQAMITQAIDALVAGSASALDTLNELASALGNDPSFATTTADALAKRVRVDAAQSYSASEQAQGRDNLGLGSLAIQNTINTSDLDDAAVTSAKIGDQQVTKAKLNADVRASASEVQASSPPADKFIPADQWHDLTNGLVVDVPVNAPNTLGEASYRKMYYVQSTGGLYFYLPAPIDGYILSGTAPPVLGDLADVDVGAAPANNSILLRSGSTWVAKPREELPVGTVLSYVGAVAPSGFFLCDGSSFAGMPILASVLGTSTLPDLRGEFIRGWDQGRGIDPGRSLMSLQMDEFKAHTHSELGPQTYGASGSTGATGNLSGALRQTGSSGGDETRPRNVALNMIIRHDYV